MVDRPGLGDPLDLASSGQSEPLGPLRSGTRLPAFAFWTQPAGPQRAHPQSDFLKNLALADGLLAVAVGGGDVPPNGMAPIPDGPRGQKPRHPALRYDVGKTVKHPETLKAIGRPGGS
ncbi:hypothetical protein [Streptacidiphilus sp. EB103A]|uniref:hypothetical protein n=1 Tax=Streptacidiphilus sp. EB103A TaxID=3156275 RepID=UPI003511AE1D